MNILLLLVAWFTAAQAHEPGLSYAEIHRDWIAITVDVDEFADRFPTSDLDAATLLLIEHTVAATGLSVEGQGCMIGNATVEPFEEDGVRIRAPIYCERAAGDWTYHASWLRGREAGHRHVVSAFGQPVGMLGPGTSSMVLRPGAPPSVLDIAAQFLLLGLQHILTGFDHLAFVLGLLLVVRKWRDAAVIVTGFTVAHSITLTLAALDLVRLSPALIEPLIALSIVWVGVENLWDPPAWRRAILTFGLGLLHGFGFAGALGEVGLPGDLAVLGLVGFNVGVELGQMAVVVLVLPFVLRFRDHERWEKFGIKGGSAVLILLGLGWFALRVMGA